MFTNDVGTDFRLDQIGAQSSYQSTFAWGTGAQSNYASGSSSNVASGATFSFDDNATLDFGTGNDTKLSFDATNFIIAGTGNYNATGFTDINLTGRVVPQSFSLPTSTTTALTSISNAINTSAQKVAGTVIFNTTTGAPVYAVGNADGSVWNDATGATAHTPV